MKEEVVFKEIPGFKGYFAASDGSIWSTITHVSKGIGNGKGSVIGYSDIKKQLKSTANKKNGRLQLCLGRGNRFYIHHLILITFTGPKPEEMEACHNDNDYLNNVPSNLRWGTSADNTEDQRKNGTLIGGQKHGMAKLSDIDVQVIRLLKGIFKQYEIADFFNVGQPTISVIHNYKSRTESSHNGKGLMQ